MRFINPGSFALAILCFWLPFVDIKCNNSPLASYTGKQMVVGVKVIDGMDSGMIGGMMGMMNKKKKEPNPAMEEKRTEIPLLVTAIILILSGITITVLTLIKKNQRTVATLTIISYSLALLGLLAEFISMEIAMKVINDKMSEQSAGMMGSLKFSWGMGTGFLLLLLLSLALIVYNAITLRRTKLLRVVENPATPENPWPSQPGEGQI